MRSVPSPVRRVLAVLLCAGALASGCSDDTGAGELVAVLSSAALLDGSPTAGGERIPFGAVLETDPSGVADFVLGPGLACRLQPRGELRVGATADAPVDLVFGSLLCSSERRDARPHRLRVQERIVEVLAARVHLEVTDEEAVVRNAGGEMTVDDAPLPEEQEVLIDRDTDVARPPVMSPPGALPTEAAEVFSTLGELTAPPPTSDAPTDEVDTPTPGATDTATPTPTPDDTATATPTPDPSDTPAPEDTTDTLQTEQSGSSATAPDVDGEAVSRQR